ncbi:LacI family DNA-binding transcriptional regulator [Actinomadura luteofluorescens]|uniref:LacI family DNA-binding transcriptional regulator n=1 Tax=Actinomadura luteofluorescens TaxID=46163 RepID=UPI0021641B66|nr:LacI family DNA-binding transcriptional regulator [Actinomadura glauciflava]MCR3740286.1 transcriptional regulator, LacI family [Actinomadura glauciflava]
MAHPTLEDVAARAGVSRALVSLVMRGSPKVGPERREAVLRAARDLGYRPNMMARSLAAGRTGMIGVLLSDLHDPWSSAVHDGLADEAARRGVRLLLATGRGGPARERAALDDLLDLRPDGVVLAGPRLPAADIERAAAGCAVTVVGRSVRSDRVDCVTGDGAAAVARALGHLADLGHHRVACLDLGPRPSPLRRACPDVAAAPDELWRAPAPPTAVLALGDTTGTGALIALLRAGKRVPEDVSLIVHGDPPGARAEGVTTIASPPAELGREAAALLLERIGEGARSTARRVTVPPLLNERGTVR